MLQMVFGSITGVLQYKNGITDSHYHKKMLKLVIKVDILTVCIFIGIIIVYSKRKYI